MTKLRFAIVGVGQIAQQAFLPAMKLVDAELTAIFTSSPEKAEHFGVPAFSYEEFAGKLDTDLFDAVYVATPVFRHREFAEPAVQAGKHVLLEKPMEVGVDNCKISGPGTLMVAYRMHQDPFMWDLKQQMRKIGKPRMFSSTFSHDVSTANHRGHNGFWGGPVPDIGAYPINLVRNLFEAEPIRVHAFGVQSPDRNFNFHDTVHIHLDFPNKAMAQISVSYAAVDVDEFRLTGSNGTLYSDSCFRFGPSAPLNYELTYGPSDDPIEVRREFEPVEQFAGELDYFIDCVRNGTQPEPGAEEGMLDVRIFDAIRLSLQTGRPQTLSPYRRARHITQDQIRRLPAIQQPSEDDLVDVTPETR